MIYIVGVLKFALVQDNNRVWSLVCPGLTTVQDVRLFAS